VSARVDIDRAKTASFCRRHRIRRLSLFGSVLRDDFTPESDVDVLVSFGPNARWGLFDIVHMEEELADVLGCGVDLVEREAVEERVMHPAASPVRMRRRGRRPSGRTAAPAQKRERERRGAEHRS
jgi:hypothetical protein